MSLSKPNQTEFLIQTGTRGRFVVPLPQPEIKRFNKMQDCSRNRLVMLPIPMTQKQQPLPAAVWLQGLLGFEVVMGTLKHFRYR